MRAPMFLRRKTLASFDEQWRALPEGRALLSDEGFAANVSDILAQEELCIDPAWLAGKTVLDVGCGNGRWTKGFLELGARVTALDAAEGACVAVRERFGDGVEVLRGDILALPRDLAGRRFDVVFAWGVLHHTGDVKAALGEVCGLTHDDGFVYLYLYGRGGVRRRTRARIAIIRAALLPFSARAKRRILSRFYSADRLHGAFDILSPPINSRLREDDVRTWLRDEGFESERTVKHTELFLRAWRPGAACTEAFRAPKGPPYWFQGYG